MANLTVNQKTNFDGYPKAAELIEITGGSALEASDRALHNMLLQIAHDSGRLTEPGADWEVSFAELRKALSLHKGNEWVRKSLRRLRRVEVTVHYRDEGTDEARTLETSLLEAIDTSDSENGGTVRFCIPQYLRDRLARSNRWGRVRSEVTFAMTSKYAMTLYELLCLRTNMDRSLEVFTVPRFRELMCVPPGTYERGDDFRKKVVDPAVLEVNGLSDIGVQIELRRRHSRAPVHEVAVAWWKQQGDEFRAAMQERQRHKSGRMARLRGQVEALAGDDVSTALPAAPIGRASPRQAAPPAGR